MNYDVNAIKKNVKILMENNKPKKMTQDELGEIIGAKQTNVSKYLNPNDSARFSLEQLICIAKYFNVTIDWLLGGESIISSNISLIDICNCIPALVESGDMNFYPINYKEDCFYPIIDPINDTFEMTADKRENSYCALFFPNWIKPKNQNEFEELSEVGNQNSRNVAVNEFLKSFAKIYPLYKNKDIDKEDYQHLLKKHLDKLNI